MARIVTGGKERRGDSSTQRKRSCSQEVCHIHPTYPPTCTDSLTIVTGIYTKTGGKNSRYSWTREITSISGAATLHVQLFRHSFRDRHTETHNQPIPGMRRFEVIAPWQFLCTASAPTLSHSGEAVLAPCDRTTFEGLQRAASSISMCMLEFSGRRGRKVKTAEEEEGDADADADE